MKPSVHRAFTLIEIMIVVLLIGILLAIAVPNFVKARESSRTKACQGNLRQIQSAKEQWAIDNKRAGIFIPNDADIFGAGKYIVVRPQCPGDGNNYVINQVNANPACGYAVINTEHAIQVTSP
jgi:prepilin-type N-terminal cleavage/methylation domain-containing protein